MYTICLSWIDPSTGAHHHQQFALPVRIGRKTANDLVLRDTRVSRWHAEIHQQDGQVIIADLHSMNGTYIDGHRVEVAPLNDGAMLQVGATQLAVVIETPSEDAAVALLAIELGSGIQPIDQRPPVSDRPSESIHPLHPLHQTADASPTSEDGAPADEPSQTLSIEHPKLLAHWGDGRVAQLAWSSDGALLAIATSLGISLRDGLSFIERRCIALKAPVARVAFTQGGMGLVAVSGCSLALWALGQGEADPVCSDLASCDVALAPNGELIALDLGEAVQILRTSDCTPLYTLPISTAGPQDCLIFAPDSQLLAAAVEHGLQICRVMDGLILHELPSGAQRIAGMAFSSDAGLFAAAADGLIELWEMAQGAKLRTIDSGAARLGPIRFTPDGLSIGVVSEAGVQIWGIGDGAPLHLLRRPSAQLIDLAFSPSGHAVAAATRDAVLVWRMPDGILLHTLDSYQDSVDALAFDPASRTLAAACGRVRSWRIRDGVALPSITIPAGPVRGMAFDPGGHKLVTALPDRIDHWRTQDGALLETYAGCYARSDGASVVNTTDEVIDLWRLPAHDVQRIPAGLCSTAYDIVLASAENMIATVSEGSIDVRQVSDGALLHTFPHQGSVNCVALASNGAFLAATLDDRVQVWCLGGTEHSYTLDQGAEQLAFSHDGTMLATVHGPVMYIWRSHDGQPLATLPGHTDHIRTIAFSHDGRMIASGSCDGTVRLWHL